MKNTCMLALLMLTAAAAAPAVAENSGTAAAADSNKSGASAKDKMVCRSEKVTGSRTKVNRTCMTQGQWDDLAEQTRKSMSEYDRAASRTGSAKPLGPS